MENSATQLSPEELQTYRRGWARRTRDRLALQEERRLQARQVVVAALCLLLPRYPGVQRAYLFGSVTRPGAFTARSDVDVGLEGADMALCFDIWRAAEAMVADWSLDLRPLDDSPFAERIRQKGELVYGRPF